MTKKIVDLMTKGVTQIFGSDLIGFYLTGSLSYSAFNPKTSDIDLVAVVRKTVTKKQLELIKTLHQQVDKKWFKRLECSYIPLKLLQHILPPKTPRPYFGEGVFYPEAPYGNEWLINKYWLYHYGIALIGPEFKTLVKPIKIIDIKQACLRDLATEWQPKIHNINYLNNPHYQSYLVLNLCRILHTVLTNQLASKPIAAKWVKKNFSQWQELIETAERWRYGLKLNCQTQTIKFIQFVVDRLL